MSYLDQARAAAKAARQIVTNCQSEGDRPMSTDERVEFDRKYAEATELKGRHDRGERPGSQSQKDADVMAHVKRIEDLIGSGEGIKEYVPGQPLANLTGRKAWAKAAAGKLRGSMREADGRKAIVSGSYGVPNIIDVGVASIGKVPTSLLDLIAAVPAASDGKGGNTFGFTRQTARTNNAAPVADNATKPTSIYSFDPIIDEFRVIAHLSEAIPLRFFADDAYLEEWLVSEMDYGLRRALEAQVIAGDGEDDNFTGILETSGILSQAFSSNVFTTTRKAKTTMENGGQIPTAFVFNPTDDEAIDLAQDSEDRFYGSGPFTSGPKTLWDLPRVASTAVTAGTAVLANWDAAKILVREGAELAVDTGGVLFEKNQCKLRYEGRYGLEIRRPDAFISIDLTP